MGLRAMLVTVWVAAQLAAVAPPVAHARALAPSPEEVERARVLDENARQLYDEGSYEGAILAWKKAFELTEYNNLLYNISMAYDRAGEFEKALEYLDRYRALASPEERAQLERRKKSLKARLDKQKKDEAEADAAGPGEPADDLPPPPPDPPADSGEPGSKPPPLFTPAAWALTGVGAVGLGLGVGFGAASLAATKRAEVGCTEGGLCSTSVEDDVAKAKRNAIVADVGIAVGAVCTVAVVAIVAVQAKRRKQARAAALAPVIMPGGGGVGFAARF